jgi:hypothetical protein
MSLQLNNKSGNICLNKVVAKDQLISEKSLTVMGEAMLTRVNTRSINNANGTYVNGVLMQDYDLTVPGDLIVEGQVTMNKSVTPPSVSQERRESAYRIKATAANNEYKRSIPARVDNGDEALYMNKMSSYSKGLPHDGNGNPDSDAYDSMLLALATGEPSDFDSIPMGHNMPVRLTNPQLSLTFDLQGADSFALSMPPAPTFDSAEQAGELVELYEQALMRDVNFDAYNISPLATAACAHLNVLSDFNGPKVANQVTPATLFRGNLSGCLTGPYISQFLYQPFHYGAVPVVQKTRKTTAGTDYMTTFPDWLDSQNGVKTIQPAWPDTRFIINARDMAEWVHMDALYQAYHHALLYLLEVGTPFNVGNPYNTNATQEGFGTFGGPHVLALLPEVSSRALKAAWNQKWQVHRRCRPEVFAARVHLTKTSVTADPISIDVLDSAVLADVFAKWGSYLLPQAFIEGSPHHPSYPAGHATVAGGCVTLLKAFFDTSGTIAGPLQPDASGNNLVAYSGPALTIEGELHKLAANISTGRNMAGIHYRTDMDASLIMGEELCISILRDQKLLYSENFAGFSFTKFDGTPVTI